MITCVVLRHTVRRYHYNQIVAVLVAAADSTVPKIPINSLRPFWNDELDELNSKSVFWFNLSRETGSPSNGWICHIKNAIRYTPDIRKAFHGSY